MMKESSSLNILLENSLSFIKDKTAVHDAYSNIWHENEQYIKFCMVVSLSAEKENWVFA